MFKGFTPATSEFMLGLALNNNRGYFEERRDIYEKELKEPFESLAKDVTAALIARFPKDPFDLHIARIYRDARRLFGRGPYKEHLWFSISPSRSMEGGPGFYFEIGPLDWETGMGFWGEDAARMGAYRHFVDDDPEKLRKLAAAFEKQSRFTLQGRDYARSKGYAGDALGPWYNKKSLWLGHGEPFNEALLSGELVKELTDGFALLMPLYRYFLEAYSYGE